jgi:hypothetical protein
MSMAIGTSDKHTALTITGGGTVDMARDSPAGVSIWMSKVGGSFSAPSRRGHDCAIHIYKTRDHASPHRSVYARRIAVAVVRSKF